MGTCSCNAALSVLTSDFGLLGHLITACYHPSHGLRRATRCLGCFACCTQSDALAQCIWRNPEGVSIFNQYFLSQVIDEICEESENRTGGWTLMTCFCWYVLIHESPSNSAPAETMTDPVNDFPLGFVRLVLDFAAYYEQRCIWKAFVINRDTHAFMSSELLFIWLRISVG